MTSQGNKAAKSELMDPIYDPGVKMVPAKKKATYEIDAALHLWFKTHCTMNDVTMADTIERLLRNFREEVEGEKS